MGSGFDDGVNPQIRRRHRKKNPTALVPLAVSILLVSFLAISVLGNSSVLSGVWDKLLGRDSIPGRGEDGLPEDEASEPELGHVVLTDEQLAEYMPNELGKVMVIMYHDIQDTEGEWVRSRENFKKDLERYYELGYTLIPFNSYLEGDISVPAGRSPLILTFDDSTSGQLKTTDQDGVVVADPDCAVGMLLEFSQRHPEFGHAATFYINFPAPFRDSARVKQNLGFLLENGMEIGNHTYNHKNFDGASPDVVAKEIGSLANEVRKLCNYDTKTLALPYGGYPKSKENLGFGEWEGQQYVNLGVLLVGAEPAASPFSTNLNPMAIPRIRGSQEELDKWLGYFERYPERRFVSDGNESVITITGDPEAYQNPELNPDKVGERQIVIYQLPELSKTD